jgi:hypothetical protein
LSYVDISRQLRLKKIGFMAKIIKALIKRRKT